MVGDGKETCHWFPSRVIAQEACRKCSYYKGMHFFKDKIAVHCDRQIKRIGG